MKWWLGSLFLICLATVFTGWFVIRPHPKDEREYQDLIHPSQSGVERSTQDRKRVRKDMHFSHLHTRIESAKSQLLIAHDSHGGLVEHMDKISCAMQEKGELSPQPIQTICRFDADRGVYDYSTHFFEANNTSFFRYVIPGEHLPENLSLYQPEVRGGAEKVVVQTAGKDHIFRGYRSWLQDKNTFLSCGVAEFDQTFTQGSFAEGIDGPYALYQGQITDRKGKQIPIEIQGIKISVEPLENQQSHQCQHYILVEQAKGQVQLQAHEANEFHSRIILSARTLIWNEQEEMFTLRDDVVISCDGFGVICSDSATFGYHNHEIDIVVSGNVRMRNQFADMEGGTPLDQYALADTVTLDPSTKKMILQAIQGKRVLFYDKANHMQISAPALTIIAGTKVGKESIKGTGDVHFTFAEQELDLLRKQFPKKI